MPNSCPFCQLSPDQLVWHSDLVVAIRDRHPVSTGHTLVIARRHVETYFDASPWEQAEIWRAVGELKRALDAELKPAGYNVGFNAHAAAGQTVMHVHVHIIPRFETILERVQGEAPALFSQLWKPIRDEADARATAAIAKLKARGRAESDALQRILEEQEAAIKKTLNRKQQLAFDDLQKVDPEQVRREQEQFEQDKKHMQARLKSLALEKETEPREVQKLYDVALHRLQPVGLVVLWPESRLGAGGRS